MSGGLLSVRRSNFQLEITNPGASYIYGVVVGWRTRFSFVAFGNSRLETPIVVSENELPEVSQRRRSKSVESGLSSPIRGPRRLFRRSARAETTPRRALGRGRPGSTASTPCIIRAQHFGLDIVKRRGKPEVSRTLNYESRSSLACVQCGAEKQKGRDHSSQAPERPPGLRAAGTQLFDCAARGPSVGGLGAIGLVLGASPRQF